MSKFAAIEARATQYPANTNDVVWLVARIRDLREALERGLPFIAAHDEDGGAYSAFLRAMDAMDEPNAPSS